jgi:anti-anti-sigma factor
MGMIVTFAGEYDVATKTQLREDLKAIALENNLILDFGAVDYVDSTALTELIIMCTRRASAGLPRATIVIRHPSVRRVFELTKVDALFHIVGVLDDAVGSNSGTFAVREAKPGVRTMLLERTSGFTDLAPTLTVQKSR